MKRLISLVVNCKGIECWLYDYKTNSIDSVSFNKFLLLQVEGKVQNFKVQQINSDKQVYKLECCDGSSKWIPITYTDKEAVHTYHNLLQNGTYINANNIHDFKDTKIKVIQLPKFMQLCDKRNNEIIIIQLLARLNYRTNRKNLTKYLIYLNGNISQHTEDDIIKYVKQHKKLAKIANAKITKNSISPIKGKFIDIIIDLDTNKNKLNTLHQITNKNKQKTWNTLLQYSKLIQKPIKEWSGNYKIQDLIFYGSEAQSDFDNCYTDQEYKNILKGHNKYIILQYLEKIQKRYLYIKDQTWLDRVYYFDEDSENLGNVYKLRKPSIYSLIHPKINNILYKIKHANSSKDKLQYKTKEHYRRTINSISDNCDDNQIVLQLLKDCIEYRIRNDSIIKNSLKEINTEVLKILQSDEIAIVVLLAAYIDFVYLQYGQIKDENSFIGQALRIHYIQRFKISAKSHDIYKKFIYLVNNQISELLKFIQADTIKRQTYQTYFSSYLQALQKNQSYVKEVKQMHKYTSVYQDYYYKNQAVKSQNNYRVQEAVTIRDIKKAYNSIVDQLEYKYTDIKGITWYTCIQQTNCYIENTDEFEFNTELFVPQDLRKVNNNMYIMCEYVQYSRNGYRGYLDYYTKPLQRLLFIQERKGKSGKNIQDIIYVPLNTTIIRQMYEYDKGIKDLAVFNIKINRITQGNKIYYIVIQNGCLYALAPQTNNFDNYGQHNITSNNKYSDINTDRPLVFSVFGKYKVYKQVINLNDSFDTTICKLPDTLNNHTNYLQECVEDLDNIIATYTNA